MAQENSDVRVEILDSITKLTDKHRGQVVVAASHGAKYAAYLAARGGARAVIFNDAGVGKDDAGISGLPYLDALGMAAATISHRSARIGDGMDMAARGVISHVNVSAETLGCAVRQSCTACADLLRGATAVSTSPPPQTENRILLRDNPDEPAVWGLDSASLVVPEDADHVIICGSHGEALGGRPETALRVDAIGAIFNDASIGIDDAGISRLPALDGRNIPAAAVSAESARIGDAQSIYEDGVISKVNETAAALGVEPGMRPPDFVDRIIAALKNHSN